MADDAASWLRANALPCRLRFLAIVGTVIGSAIAAATWFNSVHHLERRVDVLRAEVTAMRATMDQNRVLVGEVRRGLEATDASVKEGIARLEERIKRERTP